MTSTQVLASRKVPEALRVVLKSQETVTFDAFDRIGHFAVHQRILNAQFSDAGWSVTHIASGLLVWTVAEYADAMRVARFLDDLREVPADAEGCKAWAEKLGSDRPRFTHFIARLEAVAPRWPSL